MPWVSTTGTAGWKFLRSVASQVTDFGGIRMIRILDLMIAAEALYLAWI